MQISELVIGDKAIITGYHSGPSHYRQKLLVMGFTPGTSVRVVGIAPLGDPIQISLRGFLICLRKQEANILKLEKILS